ncbi:MAG TPA: hypothetical protein VGB30_05585 [bacterium]
MTMYEGPGEQEVEVFADVKPEPVGSARKEEIKFAKNRLNRDVGADPYGRSQKQMTGDWMSTPFWQGLMSVFRFLFPFLIAGIIIGAVYLVFRGGSVFMILIGIGLIYGIQRLKWAMDDSMG